MTRLSNLTTRNLLIAVHDAFATTFAVLISFFLALREARALDPRLPAFAEFCLCRPFSVVVCFVFDLTTTKWRFISLPDVLNIVRAATVLTLGC